MKQKLIPIYREVNSETEATFFLDKQHQKMYKSIKEKGNNYKFWIAWALVLALLRSIKTFHLSIDSLLYVFITILLFGISGAIGVYKYKEMFDNVKEVYYTQNTVEEYIKRGKAALKSDVIGSAFMFLIFVVFMILFLIYQWLTWLLFALFFFFLFIFLICYLSPERFNLYRRRS